ncbi:MAG: DUF922 domain-containing protein [Chloroflexota bacterium]
MNAGLSKLQIAILAILFICVCCELTGMGLFVASTFMDDSAQIAQVAPSPTPLRFATFPPTYTPTPVVTKTPAPTNTRVVDTTPLSTLPAIVPPQRTPTTVTDPYKVVVPTPTAPVMTYPIVFSSTLKVTTYPVTGKSVTDISKSLEANAISDPHEPGSRYYALTKWQLAGNWVIKPSVRGCEVSSGEVSLVMTMTLPVLATTTGVPADTLKKFNTFIDKTVLHESGHVELALQGARDYQRALGNFAPVSDCEGLKAQLSNLYRRSFDAIDVANVDYDVKTKHGLTQGAVFP